MEGAKVIIYIFVSVWLHVNKSSWVFKGAGEVSQDLVCDHHHHGTAKRVHSLLMGSPQEGELTTVPAGGSSKQLWVERVNERRGKKYCKIKREKQVLAMSPERGKEINNNCKIVHMSKWKSAISEIYLSKMSNQVSCRYQSIWYYLKNDLILYKYILYAASQRQFVITSHISYRTQWPCVLWQKWYWPFLRNANFSPMLKINDGKYFEYSASYSI